MLHSVVGSVLVLRRKGTATRGHVATKGVGGGRNESLLWWGFRGRGSGGGTFQTVLTLLVAFIKEFIVVVVANSLGVEHVYVLALCYAKRRKHRGG